MITYQTLNKISDKIIYEAFVDAFSDYQVGMNLSYEAFVNSLERRGYNGRLSMGAFEQGELAGFILNGARMWDGKWTIYDLGTGVIPKMRKQGITSRMLSEMETIMREEKIQQYLLEVIQTNDRAFRLYKKQGFQIERELMCYRIQREKLSCAPTHQVCHVEELDLGKLQDFWNSQPSWQNSNDSVNAAKEQYYFSTVYEGNEIVGYGVVSRKSGDVAQLAVAPSHRNRGIGKSILGDLMERTEAPMIQILNVEDAESREFLTRLGFENFVNQYEMVWRLYE